MTGDHLDPDPADTRYIPIIDVPGDVAESVLEELTREGIAAYAQPLDPDVLPGPGADDTEDSAAFQGRQVEAQRIHVDRARIPAARAVIASRLPQVGTGFLAPSAPSVPDLTTEQVDRAWAQLVSSWEPPEADSPGGSGLSARLIRRHDPTVDSPPSGAASEPESHPHSTSGAGPRDYSVDDSLERDEGFIPPEPPPLPRPRHTLDTIGWSGAIGGPVLLVANQVLSWGTWVSGVGVAGFMAGFVILVSRMRNERDHDDPGAVV